MVRSLNYEALTWRILSSPNGGIVRKFNSPMGGLGFPPPFPIGARRGWMRAHKPILLDFGPCYYGCQSDETRVFSIRKTDQNFIDTYKACREIHDAFLEETRPTAD